jgi:hypothetical protein
MRSDPYFKILNRLYKAGLHSPLDISDYSLSVSKTNSNFPNRTIIDQRNILLKRMEESGHIKFHFKENTLGQKRLLAEITKYGHDYIAKKKSQLTSKSLGRAALIISIISILISSYFSYKSNDEAARITELEKKLTILQQARINQNNQNNYHKTSR